MKQDIQDTQDTQIILDKLNFLFTDYDCTFDMVSECTKILTYNETLNYESDEYEIRISITHNDLTTHITNSNDVWLNMNKEQVYQMVFNIFPQLEM